MDIASQHVIGNVTHGIKRTRSIPLEPTCHNEPLSAPRQLLCCPVVKASQLCKASGLRPFSTSAQPLAGRRVWGRTPHLLQYKTIMAHTSGYLDVLCMLPLSLSRSQSIPPLQSTRLQALFLHHPATWWMAGTPISCSTRNAITSLLR